MNIQIYASGNDFATQKAIRYFKERRIKFQQIDLRKKALSKGELDVLIRAVGLESLIDMESKATKHLNLAYFGLSEQTEKLLLEHPVLLRQPVVRNGRMATVGYCPEIWAAWN